MIPFDVLIELFEHAFRPWASVPYLKAGRPTKASLQAVKDALGVEIPGSFVHVAEECSSYGAWFASIGKDLRQANHIISRNRDFRTEGLPDWAVLFNHGFDGDCDCWDLRQPSPALEPPIVLYLAR